MARETRYSAGPAFIGAGAAAQSIGYALLLVSALAALGLDRAGYPVVSELGHPIWIAIGVFVSVVGGIMSSYGYYALIYSRRSALTDLTTTRA